jgi:2-polyprenyl-6-methoxyphenol hydroxylase-like FAD-dependent oxidoreductase
VLVVDRAVFPKDTVSTHFVWPRGVSYLNRLGVVEKIREFTPFRRDIDLAVEGVHIRGQVALGDLQARFRQLHGDDSGVIDQCMSSRRHLLDNALAGHAVDSGAEFRPGTKVVELLKEDNRVTGVRCLIDGHAEDFRARVVVGADGRNSRVAQLAGAAKKEERKNCTFACYGYYSGLPIETPTLQKRGRLGIAIAPTSNEQHMVLVFGPKEWYAAFRADTERNFIRAIGHVNPDLAEMVRESRLDTRYYMTNDQSAYVRDVVGEGWALVGDAASFKDQCTASGMTHAFRDAELLAAAVHRALTDEVTLQQALTEYRDKRHVDSWNYYEFACEQAQIRPAQPAELELLSSIAEDPTLSNRLIGIFGDVIDPTMIFSTENMAQILRSRTM